MTVLFGETFVVFCQGMRLALAVLAVLSWAIIAGPAHAQMMEPPILVFDTGPEDEGHVELSTLVRTAGRRLTTIQEAPAIVTVATEAEIKARGDRSIQDLVDGVPGWMSLGAFYHVFPYVLVRGQVQAVLNLDDGMSLFDEGLNAAALGKTFAPERIKRVEFVTGPGGVLWGANALLGVMNSIGKSGRDVDGWETSIGVGTGPGAPNALRGYVMYGTTEALGGKMELFVHASVESYDSAEYEMPGYVYSPPFPQPDGPAIYGGPETTNTPRSLLAMFDGKAEIGDFTLSWMLPVARQYNPLGLAGNVISKDRPEDELPECSELDPTDPDVADPLDPCADRGRIGRASQLRILDRYLRAEWSRDFGRKLRLSGSMYGLQSVRLLTPLQVLPPSNLIEGGINNIARPVTYKVGGTLDADIALSNSLRLLAGFETYHARWADSTTRSRQGAGIQQTFEGPYNLSQLPFCPRDAEWDEQLQMPVNVTFAASCPVTFAFESNRTVLGAYSVLSLDLTDALTVDGGLRLQSAPEQLSKRAGYDTQIILGSNLVYRLSNEIAMKINYAEGFRPPIFNHVGGNAEASQIASSGGLNPERSQAIQGEINARLPVERSYLRGITMRADYSYTVIRDLILFPNSFYENVGDRASHSVEFLSHLLFSGDNRFVLGYTWLRTDGDDLGVLRTVPEHWFNVGIENALSEKLSSALNVLVLGAFEDPNRRVDVRDLDSFDPDMQRFVQATEIVVDRIPAAAELRATLNYHVTESSYVSMIAHNVFNADHSQVDPSSSFTPRAELVPSPYPRFRVFFSLTSRL